LPPDPVNGKRIKQAMGWLSLMPAGLLRWLMAKRLGSLMPPNSADTALLNAIFIELLHYRLTKADILKHSLAHD
jgi:hypothetical protein